MLWGGMGVLIAQMSKYGIITLQIFNWTQVYLITHPSHDEELYPLGWALFRRIGCGLPYICKSIWIIFFLEKCNTFVRCFKNTSWLYWSLLFVTLFSIKTEKKYTILIAFYMHMQCFYIMLAFFPSHALILVIAETRQKQGDICMYVYGGNF